MSATFEHRAPSRRKNDPEGMRARILDSAFELFQEQGYNASSVHDIAARAGVTGGALHHHFQSKKALGLAVIVERVGAAVEETWLGPLRSAGSARDAILEIMRNLARQLDGQGCVRGCPVNNLTLELAFSDEDFRTELGKVFGRWRQTIADLLERPDADAFSTMVIAVYSGAMAMAKVEQSGGPLRLCAEELERLL